MVLPQRKITAGHSPLLLNTLFALHTNRNAYSDYTIADHFSDRIGGVLIVGVEFFDDLPFIQKTF